MNGKGRGSKRFKSKRGRSRRTYSRERGGNCLVFAFFFYKEQSDYLRRFKTDFNSKTLNRDGKMDSWKYSDTAPSGRVHKVPASLLKRGSPLSSVNANRC